MQTQIYTGSSVAQIDQLAITEFGYSGLNLMKQAGESAFAHITAGFSRTTTSELSMLVLCGAGNNGGDGYVVARCALRAGWGVVLVACSEPKSESARVVADEFVQAGGVISSLQDITPATTVDVVVDALLGIGITGAPRDSYAAAINLANSLTVLKVSIDVPSGVDADTGHAFLPNFKADITITYIAQKLGLLTGPALNSVGELALEDLDVDPLVLEKVEACASLMDKPQLPIRQADSHKGRYGHVVVAGGDNGMLGAVLLAGRAALRCGSGKVHILSTDAHLDTPAIHCPELMSLVFENQLTDLLRHVDAIALGPGLGLNSWGRQVFECLIESEVPMVIDADALTLLAQAEVKSANMQCVLTPHPGEAARLLKCTSVEIQSDRIKAVRQIARQYNCLCVLKGAGTLIADASGSVSLCTLGNPGMATAGVGDVLSGMIVAFLGQGLPLRQAAEAGVWLHSQTADLIVGDTAVAALMASDIVNLLPISLKSIE